MRLDSGDQPQSELGGDESPCSHFEREFRTLCSERNLGDIDEGLEVFIEEGSAETAGEPRPDPGGARPSSEGGQQGPGDRDPASIGGAGARPGIAAEHAAGHFEVTAGPDQRMPDALVAMLGRFAETPETADVIRAVHTPDDRQLSHFARCTLAVARLVLQAAHPAIGLAVTITDHVARAWQALDTGDGSVRISVPVLAGIAPIGLSVTTTLDDSQSTPALPIRLEWSWPDGLNGLWDTQISLPDSQLSASPGSEGDDEPIRPVSPAPDSSSRIHARHGSPEEPSPADTTNQVTLPADQDAGARATTIPGYPASPAARPGNLPGGPAPAWREAQAEDDAPPPPIVGSAQPEAEPGCPAPGGEGPAMPTITYSSQPGPAPATGIPGGQDPAGPQARPVSRRPAIVLVIFLAAGQRIIVVQLTKAIGTEHNWEIRIQCLAADTAAGPAPPAEAS